MGASQLKAGVSLKILLKLLCNRGEEQLPNAPRAHGGGRRHVKLPRKTHGFVSHRVLASLVHRESIKPAVRSFIIGSKPGHLRVASFIHPFNKYLLSNYQAPGTVGVPGNSYLGITFFCGHEEECKTTGSSAYNPERLPIFLRTKSLQWPTRRLMPPSFVTCLTAPLTLLTLAHPSHPPPLLCSNCLSLSMVHSNMGVYLLYFLLLPQPLL